MVMDDPQLQDRREISMPAQSGVLALLHVNIIYLLNIFRQGETYRKSTVLHRPLRAIGCVRDCVLGDFMLVVSLIINSTCIHVCMSVYSCMRMPHDARVCLFRRAYQYTNSKPILLYVDYLECCLTLMTFSLLGIGPIIGAYGNDGAPIRLISAGDPGFISCRSCIKLN